MEKVILNATVRKNTGKKVAKEIRKKGSIPANVYKGGEEAVSLEVRLDELRNVLHTKAGENVVITLKISGDKSANDRTVLIKEMQRHPVSDAILHVDFHEISLTEELEVNVPLSAKGEPVGVKIDGGTLDHVMWELHIKCLPTSIPEKIEVDVSSLGIGQAVHIKDIKVPPGVQVLNDPELIAMIVKPPKVQAPVEEVAEGAAEPELIRKKKEEDESEEEEKKAEEAPKEAKAKEAKKE